ncbi:helix-turn-helix domain-containing protein [Streptacidiphilus fuscans]|uniref:Helix-turn-helix domain-containing protein n=1 Tax=Streptacidiphilus fuscans TaxID=2789292 RepID=A0A931B6Z1_9ACTN|nr:helix-turn-helix transcriptional regulator [Streptacidiphilus fuscans]MBF9071291.1 helix-turn-helix domain-containing protein [Streptacidiphilus fuscans]
MTLDPSKAGEQRRDLAAALRDLRRASGLSGERLAVRCGMSQSKVSRLENGRTLPTVVDVQQILNALGVDDELGRELLALARVANAEYEDVRSSVRRGLDVRQRELASLEAGAQHIRYFLPAMITGLLQTPDYMRTAMSPPIDPVDGDVNAAVALKLQRQAVLLNGSKRFDFLLTESAVRWRLCDPLVMAMQLDRLLSVSLLPNVSLAVLPLSAQVADAPFHTFTVYGTKLVTVELFTGRLALRDPKDVDHYRELFDFFAGAAAQEDDARTLLRAWSEDFRRDR